MTLNFGENAVGHGAGNLRAVLPVHLVAVVFLRIVAGRHVDAGDTAEFPDGIGKFRCRPKRRKQKGMDPVARKDLGCKL